jgi:C-terminal processing protease CtpA/Prc
MIAAFARNEGVAHVVGTRTPGEVLGAINFHVGSHYRLRIPVTAWYTAKDQLIEGGGVEPDTEQSNTVESLISGKICPRKGAGSIEGSIVKTSFADSTTGRTSTTLQ